MLKSFKLLTISAAMTGLITMTGCIVNPGNNYESSYNRSTPNTGQELKSILVYDLKDKNLHYAENALRDRGYTEYGREGSHTWWYNEENNQCYEFEAENNKIHKIHLKNANDCNNAPGNGYHQHHSKNHNQGNHHHGNSGVNFGQTPGALTDLVGARAGQAEGELKRRGYRFTHGSASGYAKNDFWRENHSGACVAIVTNEGRYQSIVYTAAEACN